MLKYVSLIIPLTLALVWPVYFTVPVTAATPTPTDEPIIIEVDLTPAPPTPTATRVPDDEPPKTKMTLHGTRTPDGWYKAPVTAVFTATDNWMGGGRVFYRLQPAAPIIQAGTFLDTHLVWYLTLTFTTPGVNYLEYYSMDKNDNEEDVRTITFTIRYDHNIYLPVLLKP